MQPVDLDTITCTHIRIHEALAAIRRALLWLLPPGAGILFLIMFWWANPDGAVPVAPAILLAIVIASGAAIGFIFASVHELWLAVRELSALHNKVLQAAGEAAAHA